MPPLQLLGSLKRQRRYLLRASDQIKLDAILRALLYCPSVSNALKKSRIYLVIAALLICGLILTITLITLRKDLTKYAIVRYLNSKNISISFSLDQLSARELLVRDIVIAEKIKIPLFHLKFNGFASLETLSEAQIQVDSVDVATLLEIKNKLQSDDSSEPLTFSTLRESCSQAQKSSIQLSLKNLTWNELTFPLNAQMSHIRGSPDFSLSYSHKFPENQKYSNVHLGRGNSTGEILISCASDKLKASLPTFTIVLGDVRIDENIISQASLNLSNTSIAITSDDKFALHLPVEISAAAPRDKHIFRARVERIIIDTQAQLAHLDSMSGQYSLTKMKVERNSDVLLQNVFSQGVFSLAPEGFKAKLNITDSSKTLNFKDVKISQENSTGLIQLVFPENSSSIRLNNNMALLSPHLGTIVKTASGKMLVQGHLRKEGERITGPLHLIGKNISTDSEYGNVRNLNFKHDLLALPSMKSGIDQRIRVTTLDVGTLLQDLSVRYHVASKEQLNIDQLEIHYEGAKILTTGFTIYPLVPNLKNFKATITDLPLQSVLKLALKDTVSAEGLLSGHVNITFHNKVPLIEGQLSANSSGWIRYRTGNPQAKAIKLSDGPMEILNAYLYDFYYETLSIEFKSDKKYEMIMTLSTYGRNPSYLRGKPLKLKVNLEQNILASFQAMMLTYDLPNKLKERLEKVGN